MNVVKLGGSVLTVKGDEPTLREEVLGRLADEIAGTGPTVVVHGAGSFGHPQARAAFDGDPDPVGVARTHRAVTRLNLHVVDALLDRGAPAFGLPAASVARVLAGALVHLDADPFRDALDAGLVPVTHGDVVPAADGFEVLSGDPIVARLASELGPERVVFVTDVDGIHDRDPDAHEDASLIRELDDPSDVDAGGSHGVDVTGGMAAKLAAIFDAADHAECWVVNGLEPGRVRKVLKGDKALGTRVRRR